MEGQMKSLRVSRSIKTFSEVKRRWRESDGIWMEERQTQPIDEQVNKWLSENQYVPVDLSISIVCSGISSTEQLIVTNYVLHLASAQDYVSEEVLVRRLVASSEGELTKYLGEAKEGAGSNYIDSQIRGFAIASE